MVKCNEDAWRFVVSKLANLAFAYTRVPSSMADFVMTQTQPADSFDFELYSSTKNLEETYPSGNKHWGSDEKQNFSPIESMALESMVYR